MAVGSVRRISITPQNGWEKNTKQCDGGLGGSGAGMRTQNGLRGGAHRNNGGTGGMF